ncbi:hypothetical protein BASA61_004384 [Batrachochytrium salamandrivorans]|nr:hypothetical protein BASA61_004384 [Batrachochytrium salamandrivorans]
MDVPAGSSLAERYVGGPLLSHSASPTLPDPSINSHPTAPSTLSETRPSTSTSTPTSPSPPLSLRKRQTHDFEFGEILGEGSYSTVLSAKETSTGREFAVKMLDKRHIVRERKTKYVTVERDVLNRVQHPFIVKLFYTFQDDHSLYFVLELAKNGDLLSYLRRLGRFSVDGARFYMAEITAGVAFLHSMGVIHRDLKPENILLTSSNHIKIADFGTARILDLPTKLDSAATTSPAISDQSNSSTATPARRASFVGTAEYCSPELLNDREASHASDVWALGCIMHQLLVGHPPFKGSNEYQTFQCIIHLQYSIPEEIDPTAASLIHSILKLVPQQRPLLADIQSHPFYLNFVWDGLEKCDAPVMTFLEPLQKPKDSMVDLAGNMGSIGISDDEVSDVGSNTSDRDGHVEGSSESSDPPHPQSFRH